MNETIIVQAFDKITTHLENLTTIVAQNIVFMAIFQAQLDQLIKEIEQIKADMPAEIME